jgi:hypothetical protein
MTTPERQSRCWSSSPWTSCSSLDQDVTIRHTRRGGNSYSLHFNDGRSFYPRSYKPFSEVVVYDGPWKSRSNLVATLHTPAEVRA